MANFCVHHAGQTLMTQFDMNPL